MSGDSVVQRIWSRDPTVWGGSVDTPELGDRLGWLDVADRMATLLPLFAELAADVRGSYDSVVLCGMGGSSLAAEVLWRVVGKPDVYPTLRVLDSTVPKAVRAAATGKSLFVISSKSGTTIETSSFLAHFWDAAGADGSHFVAITDPDTPLYRLAEESGFHRIIEGDPEIGGRFSALSPFGLAPVALVGVDLVPVVAAANSAMKTCKLAPGENPGARLGAVIGEAALAGRNKLTLFLTPSVASFGFWAEQLVAESTGKNGIGVLPVVDVGSSDPAFYGPDRLFVSLSLQGEADPEMERRLLALAELGHPVVRLVIPGPEDLGGEMFRWEFATSVVGAILGVNPFDQPNVLESKENTTRVLEQGDAGEVPSASQSQFESFVAAVHPPDYVAILAYVAPTTETDRVLAKISRVIQNHAHVPVTIGYGPRYLHSTGQLHKGGPATGHFVQVVDLRGRDLPVPGSDFSFAELTRAQADGDLQALRARERPVLRASSIRALEGFAESLE